MQSISREAFILLLILCIIPCTSAAAFNLSARTGETWIVYQWDTNLSVNVYIDGIRQSTAANFSDYYLTNLNPNEQHQIRIYNASNSTEMYGALTIKTLNSQTFIQVLICLLIVFIIILLLLKNPIKIILTGGLAAAISLYTSSIAVGYGSLAVLPLVTLIVAAVFIVLALWNIIIEKTQW